MNYEIIKGNVRDLGGFSVVRSLPSRERRSLGPFIFLDHLGPIKLSEQAKLDVNPHPHIGLSTVTYLFDGQGLHRDSLGTTQLIRPGELNWMTAGNGIVHSERTPSELLESTQDHRLHGIQFWVALPVEHEKTEPFFTHYPSSSLPELKITENTTGKLLIGSYKGQQSQVKTFSRTFFAEFQSQKEDHLKIEWSEQEMGIFMISGRLKIHDQQIVENDLIVITGESQIEIHALEKSRFVVIGGDALPEKRYMWWNFVSSNLDDIKEAATRWEKQEMGQVIDETDFIPLPDYPFPKREN